MKSFWITLLSLSLGSGSLLAAKTVETKSTIEKVTVFLNGAQVERQASQSLQSGTTIVKLTDLSPNIDPNSIQVQGKGKVTILSVKHEMNYLTSTEKPKEITDLEDQLESLKLDLKFNQNLTSVYDEERRMILANQKVGWEESAFNVEDLSDLADFYRDRLSDIMLKVLELETKKKNLQEEINKINRQLRIASGNWKKATSEISVELVANAPTTAALTVSYLVNQAGWIPSYDVRAKDITGPVALKYNGRVYQSTGVDWKDVQLTLSTGNPKLSNQKPELSPWRLRYLERLRQSYDYKKADRKAKAQAQTQYYSDDDAEAMRYEANESEPAMAAVPAVAIVDNQVNVNFDIKVNYTIPADGQRHLVNVNDFEEPATYEYYPAP
ncbi:MAG: DUF4139 domain-containing protein, partial [Salibacteraceae bacterium]